MATLDVTLKFTAADLQVLIDQAAHLNGRQSVKVKNLSPKQFNALKREFNEKMIRTEFILNSTDASIDGDWMYNFAQTLPEDIDFA